MGGLFPGCGPGPQRRESPGLLPAKTDPGQTIGSLAEVLAFEPIAVRGYGIVAGLAGTGSKQCPPQARRYLKKYILRQAPGIDANKLIDSSDTAVVSVYGLIPAGASRGQCFDVKIAAVSGIQTTSLAGGRLYTAELSPYGTLGSSRVLARAQGPVFIDKITSENPNKKNAYILGGGIVHDDYRIPLALLKPEYITSNVIRNRINERFGPQTAKASTAGLIYLDPPEQYKDQKDKFVALVKLMYVTGTNDLNRQRANSLIRQLAVTENKDAAEWALEAIGGASLEKLGALLNSANENVRLRAARCLLNLADDRGLETLRQIVLRGETAHRISAIQAVARSAKRNDALPIIKKALRDPDFQVRLAVYEALVGLDDISILRRAVAKSFYLDMVQQDGRKAIFVARSGTPKVVLFGAPVSCEETFFVESDDGKIIVDAQPGEKYIAIIRKHPRQPGLIPLKSTFELGDVIRALCEQPASQEGKPAAAGGGLAVPYSDMVAILQKMCQKGAIRAEFHAGPLPKME